MRPMSNLKFKILEILSDDKGHINAEISRTLGQIVKDSSTSENKESKSYDSSTSKNKEPKNYDKGNLSKTLNSMVKQKLLIKDNNKYYIYKNIETFDEIVKQSCNPCNNEFLKSFVKSLYVNNLLQNTGSKSIFTAINQHVDLKELRDAVIPPVLNQPAVINEYKNLTMSIRGYFDGMENFTELKNLKEKFHKEFERDNLGRIPKRSVERYIRESQEYDGAMYQNELGSSDELEILRELGVEGVRFYRENLLNDFVDIFSSRMSHQENGDQLIKYVKLDNCLSPFNAYPVTHPIDRLFSNSFERLYDDAYIIDPKDLERLLSRANQVFKNFPDFARIYIESQANIDTTIRDMIINWNIASARFEFIYYSLSKSIYDSESSKNSICFHLISDHKEFQILDMNTGEELLGEEDQKNLKACNLNKGFFEFDQIKFMRPVLIENLGAEWRKELIPIDKIISAIKVDSIIPQPLG